ncbi:sulfite exporter TauE/SafE family protein [Brevibacillus humidisoli]|uniref:sulfite exporter TauE/SafE family protein n=1 Tax=Brevibacillus humidisoli TaxID=2895522 RepID=UPI001E2D2902|nr:sulfite exporter TauE/SafE family protein [Brevibacillus humidisoli]UFJ39820.1 sulfite exporter TauE/SafE family protein [Brevibacillus humidisoli]
MDLQLIIIGLFVGFLVGLTGVGGAALLTPILVMLGVQPTIAVGTDLVYNSITKVFGALQHWRQRTVNLRVAMYFAIGSVPSAILAVNCIQWIELVYGGADLIIKKVLGFALILIPIAMIVKTIQDRREPHPNRWQQLSISEKKKITITIGAALGFIVGLTSIGSGSLFALALMYFFQMSGKEVVGTDIAHAFVLVTAAGLVHMSYGTVDYPIVFQLLAGSIPGVFMGSILATRVPTFILRFAISTIIFYTGLKLL